MNNNIQCSIESSTTKIELNSAVEGVFLAPELEGLAGLPEIRTTSGVNAGYDGGWTSAQNYDARLISIRGVIANPDVSKVEAKRRAIASLLGQGRKEQLTLRFTTEAGNSYVIYVRTISCEMALQRVLTTQEFLIQLRADDPLIYDDGASSGTEAILQVQKALGGFEIDFELPLAIGGGAEDTIVENGSETVYPIINLYGPLHSPTVVNRTTNQQMQILADLQYSISWSGYQTKDIGAYDQLDNELDGAPMYLSQLTGNAEQTTYSGKNLCDSSIENFSTYYASIIETDGALKMIANAGVSARVPLALPELTGGTTYTISFEVRGVSIADGGTFVRVREGSDGGSWISGRVNVSVSSSFTTGTIVFTPSSTVSPFLWFYLSPATTNTTNVEIYVKNIQLEVGNTATDYEPYVGGTASPNPSYPQPISTVTGEQTITISDGTDTQSHTIDLGSIELAKIGTYQDRIYKDGGKWYIDKQTGKVVLTGTEPWVNVSSANNDTTMLFQTSSQIADALSIVTTNNDLLKSNLLNTYNCYAGTNTNEGICYHTDRRIMLRVSRSRLSTEDVVGFKAWLASNPATIYYALATPTTTEITDETLLSQLNFIASLYEGVNNISIVGTGAQGEMTLNYYADVDTTGAGYEWESGEGGGPTIVQAIGVDDAQPIWTVTGPATNPTLTNITTVQTITWNGTVPNGQKLIVDMANQTATLAGANVYEFITGSWLTLRPGANKLTYSAQGADQASQIQWNGVVG